MRRGRKRIGTNIRRELDMSQIGEGLKRPGLDTRLWVTRGTVASVRGEDEQPDFTDSNAVLITPKGVEVDVFLDLYEQMVTCTYGLQAGDAWIVGPINPGDLVVVILPDGEFGAVPRIVAVEAGPHTQMPLEEDRKPVFRNDRLHIFTKTVPIEIRTAGGARVVLDQDGTVNMNQGEQGVARLQDTTQLTMQPPDIAALATALLATGVFVPSGNPPSPAGPLIFTDGEITSASDTVKAGD